MREKTSIQTLIMGSLKTTLDQQLMDQKNGMSNDATKAQKVYRLQGELHRTHLRANSDVRAHLYTMFRIKNEPSELAAPQNDLEMVDTLMWGLPTQICYNELRKQAKDWEKSAFDNIRGLKKQGHSSGNHKGGNKKSTGDVSKKKTPKRDIEYFNCGVKGHYKSNRPDLKNNFSKFVDHVYKVVVGDVVKRVAKTYDPSRLYFDSEANDHIVTSKQYFPFADGVDAQAGGFGTILLANMIMKRWHLFVEGVLYVPVAGCNLLSPGQALERDFKMSLDQEAMIFGMLKDGTEVYHTKQDYRLWTFDAHNI
ncbi:hypothetical protein GN958_ATG07420, partial [Phytophthora infestans]